MIFKVGRFIFCASANFLSLNVCDGMSAIALFFSLRSLGWGMMLSFLVVGAQGSKVVWLMGLMSRRFLCMYIKLLIYCHRSFQCVWMSNPPQHITAPTNPDLIPLTLDCLLPISLLDFCKTLVIFEYILVMHIVIYRFVCSVVLGQSHPPVPNWHASVL